MDDWPSVTCERFDGESLETYLRRSSEVIEIIQGFRRLRYRGEEAEKMEQRLIELQEPRLDYAFH